MQPLLEALLLGWQHRGTVTFPFLISLPSEQPCGRDLLLPPRSVGSYRVGRAVFWALMGQNTWAPAPPCLEGWSRDGHTALTHL